MRLEGHILCWNEAPLVPFVLDYWQKAGVDKLYVYDNGSTDGSLELLSKYPFVEIIPFETGGFTDEYKLTELRNREWKKSKGTADWVIISDFDEVPYCEEGDLKTYLEGKHLPLKTKMHNLLTTSFPEYNGSLMHTMEGVRYYDKDTMMNKCLTFPLDNLSEIHFDLGAHTCHPNLKIEAYPKGYCFFHLKHLGADYVLPKSQRIYDNLREDIRRQNRIDIHYLQYLKRYEQIFKDMWNNSYEKNIE